MAVPIGCALRLYDRGGVLQGDVHVSALERTGAAATATTSLGPGERGFSSSPTGLTHVHPLDTVDAAMGLAATSRLLVGGRLPSGSLHLLDSSRLWAPSTPRCSYRATPPPP